MWLKILEQAKLCRAKNTWLCVANDTGANLVQGLVWLMTCGFCVAKILELA